jgi:hypothetical protein
MLVSRSTTDALAAGITSRQARAVQTSVKRANDLYLCKDGLLKTKLFSLALIVVSLASSACGPADKDYTPPPPANTTEAPPPGGLEENPGQPRP